MTTDDSRYENLIPMPVSKSQVMPLSLIDKSRFKHDTRLKKAPSETDDVMANFKKLKAKQNRLGNLTQMYKSVDFNQDSSNQLLPKIKHVQAVQYAPNHHPNNIKLLKQLRLSHDFSNKNRNLPLELHKPKLMQTISLAPVTDWNLRSLDKVKPRKQFIVVEKKLKHKAGLKEPSMHSNWDPGSWFLPNSYQPRTVENSP